MPSIQEIAEQLPQGLGRGTIGSSTGGTRWEGINQLQPKFDRFLRETNRRTATKVLRVGAKPLMREIRSQIKARTAQSGASTGLLRRSIGVRVYKGDVAFIGARSGFEAPAPPGRQTKTGRIVAWQYDHLVDQGFRHAPSGRAIPGWEYMEKSSDKAGPAAIKEMENKMVAEIENHNWGR